MSIFGWSLPPGVTTLPGEEPEFIGITEQLQALGRADAAPFFDNNSIYKGEIKVKEACIDTDGYAHAVVRPYAAIVPAEYDEDHFGSAALYEDYMDSVTAIVTKCGYQSPGHGGWDSTDGGNTWGWTFTMGEQTVSVEHDDECDTDESIAAVTLKLHHAILAHCADFQLEMTKTRKLIHWLTPSI